MRLIEIAERLKCELRGPVDLEITGVAGIEDATESELTFVSNPKYVAKLSTTKAAAALVSAEVKAPDLPLLISENPYLDFARAIEFFYAPPLPIPGIHPTASIMETAELGEDFSIGANVVIGEGVRLGDRAVLYPNVTIYPHARIGHDFTVHSNSVVREHTRIGNGVTVQNGTIIGADGFGFAPDREGHYHKMVQSGVVVLEDEVEIGANACIDRATVGETRIEKGAKIDNLVQIGHGSRVGPDTVLAAQVGLAGSTKIGKGVRFAGQVGAAGHLEIADHVVATAQTGIARSVKEPGKIISGTPEMESRLWRKNYVLMHRFPDLVSKVKRLEKEIERLKSRPGEE